jgi:TRAP-type uncharacterized transport system substrate-binding protein
MTKDTQRSSGRQATSRRDILGMGLGLAAAMAVVVALAAHFIRPAPPNRIRIASGPAGSNYRNLAERYKRSIEAHGVKVELVASGGALDNLRQLADTKSAVDVGFVQGGLTDLVDVSHLVSLGTLFIEPLMVYYRLPDPIDRLAALQGKRIAIGATGSGTHALALKLLSANALDGALTLEPTQGEEAARGLVNGDLDAVFLMGDSATPGVMRSLRDATGVRLMSFRQAEAYVRRLKSLSRLTLPEGALDLAKDYPPETVSLVGPAVELVARNDLHPALSDLLISAAREIHGGAGLYRNAGEFPAPLEHDFPISSDAQRYYKSGEPFLYKALPFWLASLVDRAVVIVLPLLVILVPSTRAMPALYRWRVRSRIYRYYGVLMAIEREMLRATDDEAVKRISMRFDELEHAVNELETPHAFADQLYVLRDHVATVRRRLNERGLPGATAAGSLGPS